MKKPKIKWAFYGCIYVGVTPRQKIFIQFKALIQGNKNKMEIKEIKLLKNGLKTKIQGIYFLFDNNLKLIYIGKAIDIRQRIKQHTHINSKGVMYYLKPKYFGFIKEKDERTREFIESTLIYIFNPKYNFDKNGKSRPLLSEQEQIKLNRIRKLAIPEKNFHKEIRKTLANL